MEPAAKPALFRLAPLMFGVLALCVFGAGIWLQMQAHAEAKARVAAYVAGPPAAVPLERFDPARHTGDFGEALIGTQLDLSFAVRLAPASAGGAPAFAVPLHGRAAEAGAAPRGVAIFTGPGFDHGRITPEGLAAMARRAGPIGPELLLNGRTGFAGTWAEGLAAAGLPSETYVFYPFVEGRRAALTADAAPVFGQFAQIGGVLALIALTLLGIGRREAPGLAPDAPEEARVRAALRAGDAAHRRSRTLFVFTVATLGASYYLMRDRIDTGRLKELIAARDIGSWREVIRPAPAELDLAPAALMERAALVLQQARDGAEQSWAGALSGDPAAMAILGTLGLVLIGGAAAALLEERQARRATTAGAGLRS